ncbi:unnamed protein product, partial [Choristocarpus tenellus]
RPRLYLVNDGAFIWEAHSAAVLLAKHRICSSPVGVR